MYLESYGGGSGDIQIMECSRDTTTPFGECDFEEHEPDDCDSEDSEECNPSPCDSHDADVGVYCDWQLELSCDEQFELRLFGMEESSTPMGKLKICHLKQWGNYLTSSIYTHIDRTRERD